MDQAKVAELLTQAKYMFDHGAFGPLYQAEFFTAMAEAVTPTPTPTPAPTPEPTPAPELAEDADGVTATGTVTEPVARKRK